MRFVRVLQFPRKPGFFLKSFADQRKSQLPQSGRSFPRGFLVTATSAAQHTCSGQPISLGLSQFSLWVANPLCRLSLSFKHRPESRLLPPPITSNPGPLLQGKGWNKDKKRLWQGFPADAPLAQVCFVKTETGLSWEGVWRLHVLV